MSEEKRNEEKTVVKVKSSNKFSVILIILVMIVSFVAGFFIGKSLNKLEVSEGMVTEQLRKCSELTTAISTMSSSIKIKDGDIPYINQKKYSMRYVAEVRAGVELKKVKPKIVGKTIKVSIPHSTILNISFPENGIEFYKSVGSILNWRTQEDAKVGLKEARKKVEKHIKEKDSKLLIVADKQVVDTIEKLLSFTKDKGYKVQVSFIEDQK